MEIKVRPQTNGIGIIIFSLSSLCSAYAGSTPFVTIELLNNKPLSIAPILPQQAQANSSFTFNLQSLVNRLYPEINYRLTFVWSLMKNAPDSTPIRLKEAPNGFIQTETGENICPVPLSLKYNQSCILRFYVDKKNYIYSGSTLVNRQFIPGKSDGPIVSFPLLSLSSRAPLEQNFHSALANLPEPTQFIVEPAAKDGLHYDPSLLSIVGKPTHTGLYHFTIRATNAHETSKPRDLNIMVSFNRSDTPVFKQKYHLISAMHKQNYRLNLMELIEPNQSFTLNNQVSFKFDPTKIPPSWLSIDKETTSVLKGQPPVYKSSQIEEVTLIATSNTGGDSLPITIQIPIALDSTKRPIIETGIRLSGKPGILFKKNFSVSLIDPTADGSLKIILDKIEPPAPWLFWSTSNPFQLEGIVPKNATGQLYQLTLHANNAIGGDSERVTVPLQIMLDKSQTPHFNVFKPQLPILYPGQPYIYNFTENNEITPLYTQAPYIVELSPDENNPAWLRIENNKLIADEVPDDIDQPQKIFITIKNIPGGKSDVLPVDLFLMKTIPHRTQP